MGGGPQQGLRAQGRRQEGEAIPRPGGGRPRNVFRKLRNFSRHFGKQTLGIKLFWLGGSHEG